MLDDDDAEQEAVDSLLGNGEPASKKTKAHADPQDKATANEVANNIVLQMAAKFPTGPQKELRFEDAASAQSAASSG